MNFQQRFQQLDSLLSEYAWLWRPQPYKEARPQWCEQLPALCEELLSLSDEALQELTEDQLALQHLLVAHVPELSGLAALITLPECHTTPLLDTGPHFAAGIPGRKWQQVTAFSAALEQVNTPLLEWCGGKGHLGRLLARQWRQPVVTLERDSELCGQGKTLAVRAQVEQRFYQADALGDEAKAVVIGRHAVALHACGELHRNLLKLGVEAGIQAMDIAPCCYHLYGDERYRPLSAAAQLELSRDDMRLAVTETVTAVGREVRLRDREMAWKLGCEQLRRDLSGDTQYRPIKPINKAWLGMGFIGFCRMLAEREGFALPDGIDWEEYERLGWLRQRETMRLSLVRHAFRRAIEMWLVLDMVNHLSDEGYRVRLGTFCKPGLSPRNILISARKAG